MALTAVLFGLIAAIAWGAGDFAAAKASKRYGGLLVAFMLYAVGAVVFDVVYLIAYRSSAVFDLSGWMYAVIAGVIYAIAGLAFYKALEYGPVNIVSPLGAIYPLVTTLLLLLVFGQQLSAQQMVGIGVVVVGAAVASGLLGRGRTGHTIARGPLLALVASLCWGVAWALLPQAIDRLGWQLAAAIEMTISSLAYLPLIPVLRRSEPAFVRRILPSLRSPWLLIAVVLLNAGFMALNIGVGRVGDLVSVAVAVSACYPVLTVFLALLNLKEKFQPVPLAGALAGVAGIVVLALG